MAQISLRVNDEDKRRAEEVCDEIGISLSAAINIYIKKLGREKRIPFEVGTNTGAYQYEPVPRYDALYGVAERNSENEYNKKDVRKWLASIKGPRPDNTTTIESVRNERFKEYLEDID